VTKQGADNPPAPRPKVVLLCGPTASGKTGLALQLASHRRVEIVSADSRQVFRGMDIGTAKATPAEQALVPHHLLDVVDPDEEFSVADFLPRARRIIAAIHDRGRLPLVVGGTGLYIRALTEGLVDVPGADPVLRQRLAAEERAAGPGTLHRRLAAVDPAAAANIPPRNLVRVIRALEIWELTGTPLSAHQAAHGFAERPYHCLKLGLLPPREELEKRIAERVDEMLARGLVAEVAGLLEAGFSPNLKALQTIGYREVIAHLQGDCGPAQMRERIIVNTRRYAKRQLTWFRKDKSIIWVDSLRESARILSLFDDFMTQ
jgi:tRNA dimethylallyltransferase